MHNKRKILWGTAALLLPLSTLGAVVATGGAAFAHTNPPIPTGEVCGVTAGSLAFGVPLTTFGTQEGSSSDTTEVTGGALACASGLVGTGSIPLTRITINYNPASTAAYEGALQGYMTQAGADESPEVCIYNGCSTKYVQGGAGGYELTEAALAAVGNVIFPTGHVTIAGKAFTLAITALDPVPPATACGASEAGFDAAATVSSTSYTGTASGNLLLCLAGDAGTNLVSGGTSFLTDFGAALAGATAYPAAGSLSGISITGATIDTSNSGLTW